MPNELVQIKIGRHLYGGGGYIAGMNPGIVSVDGLPAQRPVELRLREATRKIIAKTYSSPSDGSYLFSGLDPHTQFDIVARDDPDYIYNDVIIGGVWPWTDNDLVLHGQGLPSSLETSFNRTFEITGGVPPYSISPSSVIPEGITVTLEGRNLTINSPGDPGTDLTIILEDSSTVTKTIVLAPPIPTDDPYWDNVVSLLHFDGPIGSTTFDDQSGKVWTKVGNAQISNVQSKFGTSGFFDGSGDYLTTPNHTDFDFADGDFTLEAWVYPTATGGAGKVIVSNWYGQSASYCAFIFYLTSTGKLQLSYGVGGLNTGVPSTTSVPVGEWTHVAACRTGTSVSYYINGVKDPTTFEIVGSINVSPGPSIAIGALSPSTGVSSYFVGYIDDLRVTKGIARYSTNFTVSTIPFYHPAVDPYWLKVVSLLHFDGITGSMKYTDKTEKLWIPPGDSNVKLDESTVQFGRSSAVFDGVGDYLTSPSSTDWAFGTGDFTIEMWLHPQDSGTIQQHIIQTRSGTGNGLLLVRDLATGVISLRSDTGITGVDTTSSILANEWTHLAVTRSGTTFRIFVNGILEATATSSQSFDQSNMIIGRRYVADGNGFYYYTGHIDDLRITKGYARYTATFVPPEQEFYNPPDDIYWTNVSSLLHFDGSDGSTTFADQTGRSWSRTGNAQIDTAQSKFGGASGLFDGNGGVNTPTSDDFNFGNGDFTLEVWVRPSTAVVGDFIAHRNSADNANFWFLRHNADGTLRLLNKVDNVTVIDITTTATIPVGSFSHVSVTRLIDTFKIWINGVEAATVDHTGVMAFPNYPLWIGAGDNTTTGEFVGHLDELRITKGLARYTTNFAPATEPFKTSGTGITARAFRIFIPQRLTGGTTGTNNSGYMNIGMGFASVAGGPNICSAGSDTLVAGATAAHSTQYTADYGADDGFAPVRGSASGFWHSASQSGPWWASIDFGAGNEKTVREVYMIPRNGTVSERTPYEFFIQTSPDNVNWRSVYHATGITDWALDVEKAWTIDL